MDKFFICLANSYKRGGRCVAGVEIDYRDLNDWTIVKNIDSIPKWIRPIAPTQFGEIPESSAFNCNCFSIVKLTDATPCPHNMHTEDTSYSRMFSIGCIQPTREIIDKLLDTAHRSPFGNHGKALKADKETGNNYSLMLIRPENAVAFEEEIFGKLRVKIEFSYNDFSYSLPVTDPFFLQFFRKSNEKRIELSDIYLVLSLGLEYEGWHHKLIASVIQLDGRFATPQRQWSREKDILLRQKWEKGASIQKLAQEFGLNEEFIKLRLKTSVHQNYYEDSDNDNDTNIVNEDCATYNKIELQDELHKKDSKKPSLWSFIIKTIQRRRH